MTWSAQSRPPLKLKKRDALQMKTFRPPRIIANGRLSNWKYNADRGDREIGNRQLAIGNIPTKILFPELVPQ
jgi:hypothetical protein